MLGLTVMTRPLVFHWSIFYALFICLVTFYHHAKWSKIILFGISALATSIVNILPSNLKKKIVLLVDNDKQKHGKYLSGSNFIIKNPLIIKKIKFDKVLICSYFFIKEIIDSLKKIAVSKEKIIYLK